jgi:hypothetical protein
MRCAHGVVNCRGIHVTARYKIQDSGKIVHLLALQFCSDLASGYQKQPDAGFTDIRYPVPGIDVYLESWINTHPPMTVSKS